MTLLITEVASLKQLTTAWESVKRNRYSCPGIDNTTIDVFFVDYRRHLRSISTDLKKGTYKFSPALLKNIPKANNKNREINIFIVKDKIVQKSIQISLEKKRRRKIFFPDTRNSISIGFLHKSSNEDLIGIKKAIKDIQSNYQKGYSILTVADIKDFFVNINKKRLLSIITSHLPDRSLDALIKQCLSSKILERDRFDPENLMSITRSGISQGSILSPLFSNIYLMTFDKELEKRGIVALRYADDFALFSKNQQEAEKNIELVKKILKDKALLEFHNDGDKRPKHYAIKTRCFYLGIHIEIKKGNWQIMPDEKRKQRIINKIKDKLKPYRQDTLFERISFLNRSINSWYKTYEYLECDKRILHKIYQELHECYIKEMENLLKGKGLLQTGLTESNKQFLNIMSRQNYKKRIK